MRETCFVHNHYNRFQYDINENETDRRRTIFRHQQNVYDQ